MQKWKPSAVNRWKRRKRSCGHCGLPSSSDGITPIAANSNFVVFLSFTGCYFYVCVYICVCPSMLFLSSNRWLKRQRLTGAAAAAISSHRSSSSSSSYAWNYQWPHIARVIVSNPLCFFLVRRHYYHALLLIAIAAIPAEIALGIAPKTLWNCTEQLNFTRPFHLHWDWPKIALKQTSTALKLLWIAPKPFIFFLTKIALGSLWNCTEQLNFTRPFHLHWPVLHRNRSKKFKKIYSKLIFERKLQLGRPETARKPLWYYNKTFRLRRRVDYFSSVHYHHRFPF